LSPGAASSSRATSSGLSTTGSLRGSWMNVVCSMKSERLSVTLTFAGSDEGGRRAATIYTLIATAKLNNIDPQAWPADVLARLPDHPAKRIYELLPWNWRPQNVAHAA
jgi:transposase IS66-like protein